MQNEPSARRLPYDIFLYVIKTLDLQGERSSIKRMSLTCSGLRYACQKILFRKLQLRNPYRSMQFFALGQRLLEFFQESPHIARSYREVVIIDHALTGSAHHLWLRSDPVLVDALRCLSVDEVVSFTFDRRMGSQAFEATVSPEMQNIIVDLCQSSSLHSLHLKRAPLDLLRFGGPSLRHVEICATSREEIPRPTFKSGAMVRLQSLVLAKSATLKQEVEALLKLPNVNLGGVIDIRVSLQALADAHLKLVALLATSSHSLKSFSITHQGSVPTTPGLCRTWGSFRCSNHALLRVL
jgi:hypothetical protein